MFPFLIFFIAIYPPTTSFSQIKNVKCGEVKKLNFIFAILK